MQPVAGADPHFPPAGVCISGAAGAIGSAAVRRFASEGLLVFAVDSSPRVRDLAHEVGSLVEPVQADVLTEEGRHTVWSTLREAGGIDHVIAVAGGALSEELGAHDPLDVDAALFSRSVEANLTSAWSFISATLPGLRSRGSTNRSITLCSSRNAVAGHGLFAYSAAKAGLLGMMHPLAVTLGREGIRVNAVLPGQIATPRAVELHGDDTHFTEVAARSSLGRLATEQDCAEAFWALANLRAVTGETLLVDAGAHIWRSH
jgi:NAD(P)-dependent dehydrogenase (short-subunit alcohol dehydrogenase family)